MDLFIVIMAFTITEVHVSWLYLLYVMDLCIVMESFNKKEIDVMDSKKMVPTCLGLILC